MDIIEEIEKELEEALARIERLESMLDEAEKAFDEIKADLKPIHDENWMFEFEEAVEQ